MSEEEKEQWLYEEYQYTSNFDFSRLDKYEEANNDLCIDDLILDYTMLYEHYKKEIEKLKQRLEVEIDISDGMLKTIDKAVEYIKTIVKNTPSSMRKNYANMLLIDYKKLLEILEGSDKE